MAVRVAVIGTGLIGGSLGLALRRAGCDVVGYDPDVGRLGAAKERGAIDVAAESMTEAFEGAAVVIAAVPVAEIAGVVCAALDAGVGCVTDVGSVKASVVSAVERDRPELVERFVGGHPMAGSEQIGIMGADVDLFTGSTWVLTPTPRSDPAAFAFLRDLIASVGAEVIAVDPLRHDALVAMVSHVPHLAATTLMHVAAGAEGDRATLLRLAAGGFRDMTRVAAGQPDIWPDICVTNRAAIVDVLDKYLGELHRVRTLVADEDRESLLTMLEAAQVARRALPAVGAGPAQAQMELRIPVPDRPGVLAEVTTLVGRHGVNITDLEIAHSTEGLAGVLVLVIPAAGADQVIDALGALGYRVARTPIE